VLRWRIFYFCDPIRTSAAWWLDVWATGPEMRM